VSGTFALTYDDGPDPLWTAQLLEELGESGARATFFVMTPRAVANRELIEEMLAAGHEVALHCYRHVGHPEQSEGEMAAEVSTGIRQLRSVGVYPRAWRAPWGRETDVTRRLAGRHGLRLWGWNLDSHDWRGDGCAQMQAALDADGGLRDGAVVLMHDGIGPGALRDDCEQTILLSRALLSAGAARGLRPVTVSAALQGVER
jgi:peptidoglycan/xylan/chitin deacetylase (PgdA/CDA1 family)